MRKHNVNNAFITQNGHRVSILSTQTIVNRYRSGRNKKSENPSIASFLDEKWRPLQPHQYVGLVVRTLEANPCCVLNDEEGKMVNIVEESDIMEYMSR